MTRNEDLYQAIIAGNRKRVVELVEEGLQEEVPATELLDETMIPAMREVGRRFSSGEIYVPEMLISARAMQTGLDLLEAVLVGGGHQPRGKVAIGTVKGDLHDIGKNLVAIMLKGAGFQVEDLGVDCSADQFREAVEKGSSVICLSALLTTTMPYMKTVIEALADQPEIQVIVGGAPVTREFAHQIGAHGFGEDANDAVAVVEESLGLA